jgi:hypothetical protein
LPHALVRLFESCRDGSGHPSFEQLLDALASFFATLSKTYIIVDALDELSVPSRRLLLSRFVALQERYGVNLLFTARPLPDIRSKLEIFPTLEVDSTATTMDVSSYIDESLRQLPIFRGLDPELQGQAKMSILLASNGMQVFLLVCPRDCTNFPQGSYPRGCTLTRSLGQEMILNSRRFWRRRRQH